MDARKVLIVDDEELVRRAVKQSLERAGFEVQEADGISSAERALESTFDAVVLDMVMPNPEGKDSDAGLVVLKRIAGLCPRPAVVILTQYDSLESTLETLELGADAYLPKMEEGRSDIIANELPRVLNKVLEQRRNVISDPQLARRVKRAREIQRRGFPKDLLQIPSDPSLTIAGGNLPAIWVSGDAYDFVHLADDRQIPFMLCDVSGHDLTAALVSMHLRAIFRMGVQRGLSLTAIDRAMHDSLGFVQGEEMFATGILGVLHLASQWIELAVAGHPLPSVVGSLGAKPRPTADRAGGPWGMPPNRPCLDGFDFGPGRSVVFYSDGLREITNNAAQQFGENGVDAAHQRFSGETAGQLRDYMLYEAVKFADRIAAREDDMTVLAIHWAAT